MTRRTTYRITLSLAVAVAVGAAYAQSGSANKGPRANSAGHLVFADDEGLAINGYDTVAYHTDARPTPGAERFSTEWRGATWRFATAENLAAFQGDPERYAPAYGGYCAWGVGAKSDLFPIDPAAWKIVDGRLFLNYNADIQQQWLADVEGFIRTADTNWPALVRDRSE